MQTFRHMAAATVAAILMAGGGPAVAAQAAGSPSPPFGECPAIGNSPSCEILLVVNADGSVSVKVDPSVGPFDGGDDTLVGIVNDSRKQVTAVTVSGPGSGLSGFDGDGICSGQYGAWNGSAGCPYGLTGYEGPGTSFATDPSLPDSAQVDFTSGLAPRGSTYFSLEGALSSARLTAVKGPVSFTVSGGLRVLRSGSQDTHADVPGSSCNRFVLHADRIEGYAIANGFERLGAPYAAMLLRHFLGGSGIPVDISNGTPISRDLLKNPQFQSLNNDVQAYIQNKLSEGKDTITVNAPTLRRIGLYSPTDLHWSFGGTQGLDVTGSGSLVGSSYTGTLTYTIRDSYGFSKKDYFYGIGRDMRYLQTSCGSPYKSNGARWFPDSITITVNFSLPAAAPQLPASATPRRSTGTPRAPEGTPGV